MAESEARSAGTTARAATWADADALAATMARAFHDDPLICFILRDEAARAAMMPRLFKLLFKLGLPHGACDVTAGIEAAALWRPPNAWEIPWWQYVTNGAEFLGIFGFGGARHVTQRDHASTMPFDRGQPPLFGPAAIAVHNDGHVARYRTRTQRYGAAFGQRHRHAGRYDS